MGIGVRRLLIAAAMLLSSHTNSAAESPFAPHFLGVNDDPVCPLVLQHYTRLFKSQAQESSSHLRSGKIKSAQFEARHFFDLPNHLLISEAKLNKKRRLVVYDEYMPGYSDIVHNIYVIKHDKLLDLANRISKKKKSHDIDPDSAISFRDVLMGGDDVRVFIHRNNWYVLADSTVFLRDEGVRIIYRLEPDGPAREVCSIQIFKNFNPGQPPGDLAFYATYVNLLEEIMGSYCCIGGRRTGRQQSSAAVYRPWATARSWAYSSPDDPEHSSHNRSAGTAWTSIKSFNNWQYHDAWSFRQFETIKIAQTAAVDDLITHYVNHFHMSRSAAERMAHDIVDALPSSYSQFGENLDGTIDNSFLRQIAHAQFTDWANLPSILKDRQYSLPPSALTVSVDAPHTFPQDKISIDLRAASTEYGKDLLMFAAHMNNYDSTEHLLRSGWPLDRKTHQNPTSYRSMDRVHRSALTYAAENASVELIELLVNAGADTAILDSEGNGLDYYVKRNPRFSAEDSKLGFDGILKKYTPTATVAPSFACSPGLDRVAQAICESKGLSVYDRELDANYRALMTRDAFAERLRSDQRAWLRSRDRECDAFAEPDQLNACIARTTRARIRYLEYLGASLPAN